MRTADAVTTAVTGVWWRENARPGVTDIEAEATRIRLHSDEDRDDDDQFSTLVDVEVFELFFSPFSLSTGPLSPSLRGSGGGAKHGRRELDSAHDVVGGGMGLQLTRRRQQLPQP